MGYDVGQTFALFEGILSNIVDAAGNGDTD